MINIKNFKSENVISETKLTHSELPAFVRQFQKPNTWIMKFYWFVQVLLFGLICYFAYSQISKSIAKPFEDVFIGLGTGFAITFFLAFTIHESIHLLTYMILGSKKVTLRFKNMMFLALSYDAVLNRKEFYLLAIMPFAVITPILCIILFFVQGFWFFTVLGILFLHTAGCSGDFALINYFFINRNKALVTFDVVEAGITYFYEVKNISNSIITT